MLTRSRCVKIFFFNSKFTTTILVRRVRTYSPFHGQIISERLGLSLFAPRPFQFPQGFWDSRENGDIDVPRAKECVGVGGGVVFKMQ